LVPPDDDVADDSLVDPVPVWLSPPPLAVLVVAVLFAFAGGPPNAGTKSLSPGRFDPMGPRIFSRSGLVTGGVEEVDAVDWVTCGVDVGDVVDVVDVDVDVVDVVVVVVVVVCVVVVCVVVVSVPLCPFGSVVVGASVEPDGAVKAAFVRSVSTELFVTGGGSEIAAVLVTGGFHGNVTGGPPTPYGPAGWVPNRRGPPSSDKPSSNPVGTETTRLTASAIGLGT
jgi:hypothetical protein